MRRTLIAALIALPAAAAAEPGLQLQRLIAMGLRDYGIRTDVTQLTTAQAAALHLELSSPEDEVLPFTSSTRQKLLAILRWNDATGLE